MSASTAPRDTRAREGKRLSYKVGQVKINKGTAVYVRVADGYAYPGRSNTSITDVFVGVAYETVDNSGGTAGAVNIQVVKTGVHYFLLASAAQTTVGQPVYFSDDQTVTTSSGTTVVLGGYITDVPDTAGVNVRIDRAVN